jgi:hypothetical protein
MWQASNKAYDFNFKNDEVARVNELIEVIQMANEWWPCAEKKI